MQRVRFWILCAMGSLVIIAGLMLVGTKDWLSNAKALKNMLPADVDMRLDNLTLSEIDPDNREMTIKANSAQYYKTQDIFVLDTVRAQISADQGYYDITADSANYNQGQRVIDLMGNVQVADGDGGVLTCDTLELKFDEGLLASDDKFCYATPKANLEGNSFIFYTREKLLKVEGRTHFLLQ